MSLYLSIDIKKLFPHSWPNITQNEVEEALKNLLPRVHADGLTSPAKYLTDVLTFSLKYYKETNDNPTLCFYSVYLDYLIEERANISSFDFTVERQLLLMAFVFHDARGAIQYYFDKFVTINDEVHLRLDDDAGELQRILRSANLMEVAAWIGNVNLIRELCTKISLKELGRFNRDQARQLIQPNYCYWNPWKHSWITQLMSAESLWLESVLSVEEFDSLLEEQQLLTTLFEYFVNKPFHNKKLLANFEARFKDFCHLLSLLASHGLHEHETCNISMQSIKNIIDSYVENKAGETAVALIKASSSQTFKRSTSTERYLTYRSNLLKMINPVSFGTLIIRFQEFFKKMAQLTNDSQAHPRAKELATKIYIEIINAPSSNIIFLEQKNNDASWTSEFSPEIMLQIMQYIDTPKALLSLGSTSRDWNNTLFDKVVWQRFMPKPLQQYQYPSMVYKFFAQAFYSSTYQLFLEKWQRNPTKFHESLMAWTTGKDFVNATDDPVLPLLLGLSWADEYCKNNFQKLTLEQKRAFIHYHASHKEKFLLSLPPETWAQYRNAFIAEFEIAATNQNNLSLFHWLLSVINKYETTNPDEFIFVWICKAMSKNGHFSLLKNYMENCRFNVNCLTTNVSMQEVKKHYRKIAAENVKNSKNGKSVIDTANVIIENKGELFLFHWRWDNGCHSYGEKEINNPETIAFYNTLSFNQQLKTYSFNVSIFPPESLQMITNSLPHSVYEGVFNDALSHKHVDTLSWLWENMQSKISPEIDIFSLNIKIEDLILTNFNCLKSYRSLEVTNWFMEKAIEILVKYQDNIIVQDSCFLKNPQHYRYGNIGAFLTNNIYFMLDDRVSLDLKIYIIKNDKSSYGRLLEFFNSELESVQTQLEEAPSTEKKYFFVKQMQNLEKKLLESKNILSNTPPFSYIQFNETIKTFRGAIKTAIASLQISNPSLSLSFSPIDNKDDAKKRDNYIIIMEEKVEDNKQPTRQMP